MKILVTGGTGFIGSHLVERLSSDGHTARVLVLKKDPQVDAHPERAQEIFNMLRKNDVELCYGNLLDPRSLEVALRDIDVVFHLAAIARPMAIPRQEYFDVNEIGTKNLLEACSKIKLKKIICMSSVSAVGPSRDGNPVNENTSPNPVDVYGESKLAAEKVINEYIKKGLPIVILRPPMVYGPRDYEMLRLFKAVKKRFFPIKGSSTPNLEFSFVGNIVEGCIRAWKRGTVGEIYHLNDGQHYTISQIISAIEKAENTKVRNIKFPDWSFKVAGFFMELLGKVFNFRPPFNRETIVWMSEKYWYSDTRKAVKYLGFKNFISLEDGTKKTVEWYNKHRLL